LENSRESSKGRTPAKHITKKTTKGKRGSCTGKAHGEKTRKGTKKKK